MKAFSTVANLSYFLFERFCLFTKDGRRPTMRVKMLKDGRSIMSRLCKKLTTYFALLQITAFVRATPKHLHRLTSIQTTEKIFDTPI